VVNEGSGEPGTLRSWKGEYKGSSLGVRVSGDRQRDHELAAEPGAAAAFNGLGLGLGLTVVRELVEAHGGHVVARSAGIGLGSQFVVALPLASSRPPAV